MRTLFILCFLLFSFLIFAQPADCDDRQIYASLQVVHLDCDSIVLEAYPNGSPDLQWYVNGEEVAGATNISFQYIGPTEGFAIGVVASDGTYCRYTEYLVEIEGGCPVEDCTNGIDDDGNGLIDLNDREACDCDPPPEQIDFNLFPNPGFEARRDLPECQGCYDAGQAFPCVSGWQPGNSSTTIEHVLRCYATGFPSRFIPYVTQESNFSLIGGFAAYDSLDFTSLESALVPLLEPTIPGERYRLIFDTDIVGGKIYDLKDRVSGDIFQYLSWYTSPVVDSFPYRFNDRGDVAFGGSWDNWTVLDSVAIEVNDDFSYEQFTIEFIAPPEPIRAMVFAGARTQPRRRALTDLAGDYEIYWALDNVQLKRIRQAVVLPEDIDATISASQLITSTSMDNCAADLQLSVPFDPGSSYQWYVSGVAIVGAVQSNYVITSENLDARLYQVRIINNGTCKTSDPVPARKPEPFTVTFSIDSIECGGNSNGQITMNILPENASYSLDWRAADNTFLGEGLMINNLSTGDYFLTVTDAFGCTYPYAFELLAPPALVAELTAEDVSCNSYNGEAPLTLDLTGGTPPYQYYYDQESEPAPRPLRRQVGTYRLRIVDDIGCELTTEAVTINEPDPFSLDIISSQSDFLLGEAANARLISNRSLTEANIEWTPESWASCQDCLETILTPTETRKLHLTVTDADGCIRTDSLAVRVIPDYPVYIPNAISPNGDGVNDVFRVFPGQAASTVLSMEIFDRWGSLHYRGVAGDINWQPSTETSLGVYAFFVKIRFADGLIRNYYGEITVLP